MKKEYIEKITDLLIKCDDLSLLDLIYRILEKQQKGGVYYG